MATQWGFLRETKELAQKAGKDADTGVCRTGIEEYLKVIFPNTDDWIHDRKIDHLPEGTNLKKRPDYRSESLKMIIEIDGLPHYQDPQKIVEDEKATALYESFGYKVVRIPYFIQLTKKAVKEMFGVDIDVPLFDERIPSLGIKGKNTPAYLCVAGIKRMAKEFSKFPEQYETNRSALCKMDNDYLTGITMLEEQYRLCISIENSDGVK